MTTESNQILLLCSDLPDVLPVVHAYLKEQGATQTLASIDDDRLPESWYVTTGKGMTCDIAIGAFTELDAKALVQALRTHPWSKGTSFIQLSILGAGDEQFQLHRIWPLRYARSTFKALGGLEHMDRDLGPVTDLIVYVKGTEDLAAVPETEAIRAWLEAYAPGAKLDLVTSIDFGAWGAQEDREPKLLFRLAGPFNHSWVVRFKRFVERLPWDRHGGGTHVDLWTSSAKGWRTRTRIAAPRSHNDSVWTPPPPPRLLELMQAMLALTLSGPALQQPTAADLERLDELAIHYMQLRGYNLLEDEFA